MSEFWVLRFSWQLKPLKNGHRELLRLVARSEIFIAHK